MSDPISPMRAIRPRLILAAICVAVVLAGGLLLRASSFDLPVVRALNGLHTGATATIGDLIYRGIGPVPAIIVTAVLTALIVLVRRDLATASTFAVTIAVTWLSSAAVKILVARPRPEASLLPHPPLPQSDASYPSGHTVFITTLAMTAILVTTAIALRRLWVVLGIVGVIVVALCVLSDGLHFPTDVLASIVWAIGLAPLVAVLWSRLVIPRVPFLRPRRAGRHGTPRSARS